MRAHGECHRYPAHPQPHPDGGRPDTCSPITTCSASQSAPQQTWPRSCRCSTRSRQSSAAAPRNCLMRSVTQSRALSARPQKRLAPRRGRVRLRRWRCQLMKRRLPRRCRKRRRYRARCGPTVSVRASVLFGRVAVLAGNIAHTTVSGLCQSDVIAPVRTLVLGGSHRAADSGIAKRTSWRTQCKGELFAVTEWEGCGCANCYDRFGIHQMRRQADEQSLLRLRLVSTARWSSCQQCHQSCNRRQRKKRRQ